MTVRAPAFLLVSGGVFEFGDLQTVQIVMQGDVRAEFGVEDEIGVGHTVRRRELPNDAGGGRIYGVPTASAWSP